LFALLYLFVLYAPILLLPIFAFNDGTVIAFPLQGFTLGMVRPPAGDAGAARGHAQFADHRGQRLAPGDLPRPFRGARGHAVQVSGQGRGSWASSCCRWSCRR
jgi:hypothetical protein